MNPLQTVVVGVDGSESAAAALRWVVRRMPADGVLHVVTGFDPAASLVLAAFQQDSRGRHDQVEALLNGEWTAPATELGADPVCHLVDDDPADALLYVAADVRAATIVVGVHGERGHRSHFIGGVTRKLLRHSPLPVIVAIDDPDPAGEDDVGDSTRGGVLGCVGYGRPSNEAVEWAASYAKARGLRLDLLHAVSDRPIYPLDSPMDMLGSYLGPGVDLEWAAEDLDTMKALLVRDEPELVITATAAHGSVVSSILDAAPGADLVVVGKPSRDPLARLTISPRLYQLIVRASRSMAIVPSDQAES